MHIRKYALGLLLLLTACGTGEGSAQAIAISDGAQIHTISASVATPAELMIQAGILLGPNDRVLANGIPTALDQTLPQAGSVILQVRRAFALTLITPNGQQALQTAAETVGDALHEAGISLYESDFIDPPVDTPIDKPLTVNYIPSRELTVVTHAGSVQIRSAARTVGEALAEAGIPLLGLDYSQPSENEALPNDGQIHVVHVSESVVLAQKPIAFQSKFEASANVELDQQQILQPGQTGLSVSRVRIRYEDGQEVSRLTESETVVRPPQDRIVGYGTKIVTKTATVDGVRIEYWRAVQIFATSYSPCRSGGNQCYPGTASGLPVKKGVAAVNQNWYSYMNGQQIYVTGYGKAVIADLCGGCVGKPWIDLGYSDNDYVGWGSWVTVYFLTPAPQTILYVLE